MSGFIKIYRELLHSDLLRNPDMMLVLIFLCKQARYKKTIQDGIEILPGQVLISAGEIARVCSLNKNRVNYILRCLEKDGLIRRENIRNRYSLITVTEPQAQQEKVPSVPVQPPQRPVTVRPQTPAPTAPAAPAQPASADVQDQPENAAKTGFGTFGNVYLTVREKAALQERCAFSDSYIDNLSAYKQRTHKAYADDYSVLCEWISKDDINEKRGAAKQAALQLRREKEKTAKENKSEEPCAKNHFMPGPASYDLEAAEERARTSVPKLKKRRQPST